jgi:C1A family cysteine protease
MSDHGQGTGSDRFGALRGAAPARAPTLSFRGTGRDRKVDLRRHASPIIDQGKIGTCAACAGVSALEQLVIRKGERLERRSPMFLYFNSRRISGRHTNTNGGLMICHVTAGVMAWGVCTEQEWPYVIAKATQEPPQAAFNAAQKFDAIQYARLASAEEAKVSISKGLPVIFGVNISMPYYEAARANGRMPQLDAVTAGEPVGHIMLAVGYDDDAQLWLVKNSWGEGHGDRGYLHIPYSVLEKHVWPEDLWVIGELEQLANARFDGSTSDAVAHARANGEADVAAAMKALGQEIGKDLDKRVDDARTSIRERLQAQERALEAKRKKD